MDLTNLTIKKFHEGLLKKEFSALEITQKFFDYIEKKDQKINAYLRLTKDLALSQAKKVDADLMTGKKINVLAGVPVTIKDNILINSEPCTAASKILENYQAVYDATVIKKLKSAEVVFLGKTNLDEFAMGSSTENSAFQITHNPWDLERVPGGSSGGSAAAVAAGMAIAALGSDTGGSIRQPAAFCGVVGLKPTYGAVSRYGLIAMASSLDQIGPITKTVEDAEILFNAIKGKDQNDSTSVELNPKSPPAPRLRRAGEARNPKQIQNIKIGLPEEYFVGGLDKKVQTQIEEVIENLKKLGFKFKKISLPHTKYAVSCYYIIMPAEASTNLARYDGICYGQLKNLKTPACRLPAGQAGQAGKKLKDLYFSQRSRGFGSEVKRRIILGTFVLSSGYYDAYYLKAQKVRRLIKEDFDKAFKEVNIILTPVSPTPAFKIGEKINDPLAMYLSDIFTIPVNLAGLPAISIPPGFQLIGKSFQETDILEIGKIYEQSYNLSA